MFLGELIEVDPEQKSWHGAIERALGGLRTTLAVPESSFSMVTRWLNQRHTGLHVRVQVVRSVSGNASFKNDGFLRKLKWREHPYREWLKQHLSRHDLHCVANTEELDITAFSMTERGLIHLEKGRFEKKDQQKIDDRRVWQLGFSNKDRLSLLQQDLITQQDNIEQFLRLQKDAKGAVDLAADRARLWKNLAEYQWDEINVPYWQHRVDSAKEELQNLQKAGGDLDKAQLRWDQAKQQLASIQNKKQTASNALAVFGNDLKNAQATKDQAGQAASEGIQDLHERVWNSELESWWMMILKTPWVYKKSIRQRSIRRRIRQPTQSEELQAAWRELWVNSQTDGLISLQTGQALLTACQIISSFWKN